MGLHDSIQDNQMDKPDRVPNAMCAPHTKYKYTVHFSSSQFETDFFFGKLLSTLRV